jgi:FkbM family methyltransferase
MLTRIKDKISRMVQRALGIEDIRSRLNVNTSKLDAITSSLDINTSKLDAITSSLDINTSKLDAIISSLDINTSKLDAISSSLDINTSKLDAITPKLDTNGSKLDVIKDKLAQLDPKLQNLVERSDSLFWQIRQNSEGLEQVKLFDKRFHERMAISESWLPEEHFLHSEPEYYLAAFLFSFLPSRTLLDVGAHVGDFAEVVSDSGYQVYAFEPFAAAFERLKARMADRGNVKTFNLALGSKETTLPLYIASGSSEAGQDDPSLYNTFRPHFVREGLAFAETVDVPVRTIESLIKSGELPEQIDFLKVDTEGFDLEVIKGLGVIRPSVVQTEFWGDDFVFVRNEKNRRKLISPGEIIREMRNRDYFWNLIVFRVEAEAYVRFAANLANAPKRAWGNMLFFRDHSLFLEALRWCQGALPRFQALAPGNSRTSSGLPTNLQPQASGGPPQNLHRS